ncbi:MAG: hypothetical protein AAFQ89_11010 [Cyanobacteria bacterium J06626_18]
MNSTFETITLRPKAFSAFWLLLLSSLFVTIGIWMGVTDSWVGYLIAAFFALGILVGIVQLLPNSTYLRISHEGITCCNMFRETVIPLDDVDEFFVVVMRQNGLPIRRMVGFNYAPTYARSRMGHQVASAIAGCEGALPDTYGKKAEDLAALLNDCLHEFRTKFDRQ